MGSKLLVAGYVFGAIFAIVGILGAAFGNDLINYFVTSVSSRISRSSCRGWFCYRIDCLGYRT